MYQLEIKLKQHTPLIHFQHDQEGATLRASEVKPKLDKFILSKLVPETREKGKNEGWIKDKNGKVWLDYKMIVEAKNFQSIQIPIKPVRKRGELQTDEIGRQLFTTNSYPDNNASLIMSNIGGRVKDEVHNFSMASSVQMKIFVNYVGLEQLLIDNLNIFFGRNSFGNRTSKGFGSFEVKSINEQEESGEIDTDSYILSFTMNLGDKIDDKNQIYRDVFRVINSLWKSLKNISEVRGKSENNVLLKISPQNIRDAERIPSPIRFKPYIDFYKDGGAFFCDINIAFLFDKDVIKQVTGMTNTAYYKSKLTDLKNNIGSHLYEFLDNNTECKIDRKSVNFE